MRNKKNLVADFIILLFLAMTLLFLSACPDTPDEIAIYMTSGAPPTQVARLDEKESTITLSAGVVVSVSCWNSCNYYCEEIEFSSQNSSVVDAREVFNGGSSTGYVLVAGNAGSTELKVSNDCAEHTYHIEVLSNPDYLESP